MNSKLKGLFDEVKHISENPYEKAIEAKKNGTKIVGYFAINFPEELIAATGCFPLLIQESLDPVTVGHAYYYSFFCGPSRSLVDQAMKDELDFLDVLITGDYCIQEIGAGEVIGDQKRKIDNLFFRLPIGNEPWTVDDIEDGLGEMRHDLEKSLGVTITDSDIENSIKLYNRNRALLREIYSIREKNPMIITPVQLVQIIQSSMVTTKEENNLLLEKILEALKEEPVQKITGQKVFLSGSLCGAAKFDILNIITRGGAVTVGDDMFHGWRYISTDIADDKKPMTSIAEYYLIKDGNCPCPTRVNPKSDWPKYLVDECNRLGVQEVFILQAKYCEPHMFFYPDIKEAFDAAGINFLLIDVEHEVVSLEALRTRIEAFVEMNEIKAEI